MTTVFLSTFSKFINFVPQQLGIWKRNNQQWCLLPYFLDVSIPPLVAALEQFFFTLAHNVSERDVLACPQELRVLLGAGSRVWDPVDCPMNGLFVQVWKWMEQSAIKKEPALSLQRLNRGLTYYKHWHTTDCLNMINTRINTQVWSKKASTAICYCTSHCNSLVCIKLRQIRVDAWQMNCVRLCMYCTACIVQQNTTAWLKKGENMHCFSVTTVWGSRSALLDKFISQILMCPLEYAASSTPSSMCICFQPSQPVLIKCINLHATLLILHKDRAFC